MHKNNICLSAAIAQLTNENVSLKIQLQKAQTIIEEIRAGNIDSLVIVHKKIINPYTEDSADKIYRVFIEKMPEGAVALHENGTILYCNSSFATMVDLPLEKVIGVKLRTFIADSSKKPYSTFIKKSWQAIRKARPYYCLLQAIQFRC